MPFVGGGWYNPPCLHAVVQFRRCSVYTEQHSNQSGGYVIHDVLPCVAVPMARVGGVIACLLSMMILSVGLFACSLACL